MPFGGPRGYLPRRRRADVAHHAKGTALWILNAFGLARRAAHEDLPTPLPSPLPFKRGIECRNLVDAKMELGGPPPQESHGVAAWWVLASLLFCEAVAL